MATCSSVTAWETLWTEEPGGLQSMGSQSRTGRSTQTHSTLCDLDESPVRAESFDPVVTVPDVSPALTRAPDTRVFVSGLLITPTTPRCYC